MHDWNLCLDSGVYWPAVSGILLFFFCYSAFFFFFENETELEEGKGS